MSMKMIPALDDVESEINQKPGQKNAGHDRPKHDFPHIKIQRSEDRHSFYLSALASRETSVSISFTYVSVPGIPPGNCANSTTFAPVALATFSAIRRS